ARLGTRLLRHAVDESTDSLKESPWVRHVVNHKLRQHFSNIQRHKSAFFDRGLDRQSLSLQSSINVLQMSFRREDNDLRDGRLCSHNKTGEAVEKNRWVGAVDN